MTQVLVVEDEELVAKYIQNSLQRMGYAVPAIAQYGEEAIKKTAETHCDLVLMDIKLDGNMDGIDAAQQIHTRFNVPIIYLTAHADDTTLQRAKKTEPFGYIRKPFDDQELQASIELALFRHGMERKLKDSEERYRTLYEDNPSMYFTVDQDGIVLSVNKFGAEQLGYTVEELLEQSVLTVFHPEDRDSVLKQLNSCLQSPNEISQWEFRKVRKDGSIMWVEETARAVRNTDGRVSIFIVCEDITERKKLEHELLKAQKLESIGVLAGGIAHDFNNILTAILGNISLAKMMSGSENPDKIEKLLSDAENACVRARELTQKLLTFSKGGAPVKRITSISELITDSIGSILYDSYIHSEFSLPHDLWLAKVDEGQIRQVIINLIKNAVQAMPSGGKVRIGAENVTIKSQNGLKIKNGDYVKISVQDNGIGISAENLYKIFDPFFTTKQTENGLGLAISYSIVQRHKGHISVESEIGVGTTFYVYLPAIPKEFSSDKAVNKVIQDR